MDLLEIVGLTLWYVLLRNDHLSVENNSTLGECHKEKEVGNREKIKKTLYNTLLLRGAL